MSASGSNRLLFAVVPLWFLLVVMAVQLQTVLLVMGIVAGVAAYAVGTKFLDRELPDSAATELALTVGAMAVVSAWWTLTDFSVVSSPISHVRNAIALLAGIVVVAVPMRTGDRRPRTALVGYGAALVALPFVIGGIGTDALVGCSHGGGWSSIDDIVYGHFEIYPSGYRVEDIHLSTLTVDWYDGCMPREGPLFLSLLGTVAVAAGVLRSRS